MATLTAPDFNKVRGAGTPPPERAKAGAIRYLMLGTLLILLIVGASKTFLHGKQTPATIDVVAAAQDIPAGCKISFSSLHYLTIPRRYASSSMYGSYEKLVGKTSRNFIAKGNPFLDSDVLSVSSIAETLPSDMRAITLQLDAEAQIDYSLQPGDKVDVIVTATPNWAKQHNRKFTKTVCENLAVILCTQRNQVLLRSNRSADQNRVTLAASPADCELLSMAASTGKIRLVLRSPASPAHYNAPGADEKDLIPGFALKEIAMQDALDKAPTAPSAFIPPPPADVSASLPPPPLPQADEGKAPDPIGWVVQMFSGSKKETYAVPNK